MNIHQHEPASTSAPTSAPAPAKSALAWKGALIMLAFIAAFFLLREHWGHALGVLPYALLLACPIMHLFMHGGHGHGAAHDQHGGDAHK